MHMHMHMHRHVSEYLAFACDAAACSHAALVAFARPGGALLAQTFAEALWHGNTTAADAAAATRGALGALRGAPLPPSQRPAPRLLRLPAGVEVVVRQHASLLGAESARHANPDESNSAVEVYLQVDSPPCPALHRPALHRPALHRPALPSLPYTALPARPCLLGAW